MENRRIELHPEAEQEYLNAISWYGQRSITAGTRFESAFQQALDNINEFPLRWAIYFDDVRRYTLRRFPFNIFYRFDAERNFIIAVAHGRRKPGYWLSRR